MLQFGAVLFHERIEFGHVLVQRGLLSGNFQGGLAVAADAHMGLGAGIIGAVGTHIGAAEIGIFHAQIRNLLGGEKTCFKVKFPQGGECVQKGGIAVSRLDEHGMEVPQLRQLAKAGQAIHGVGGEDAPANRKFLQGLAGLQKMKLLGDLLAVHDTQIGEMGIVRHIPQTVGTDVPVHVHPFQIGEISQGGKVGDELTMEQAQILVILAIVGDEMLQAFLIHTVNFQNAGIFPCRHFVVNVIRSHVAGIQGGGSGVKAAGIVEPFFEHIYMDEPFCVLNHITPP